VFDVCSSVQGTLTVKYSAQTGDVYRIPMLLVIAPDILVSWLLTKTYLESSRITFS